MGLELRDLFDYNYEKFNSYYFLMEYNQFRDSAGNSLPLEEILKAFEKECPMAGFFVTSRETAGFTEIINDYFRNNIAELQVILTDEFENLKYKPICYIQAAYIGLMRCSDETVISDLFEVISLRKFETERYTRQLFNALTYFHEDVIWHEDYCRILTGIYNCRGRDIGVLRLMERFVKSTRKHYLLNSDAARRYFDLLLEEKEYVTARDFLNNFSGFSNPIGFTQEEVLNKIFQVISPELWAQSRYYMKNPSDEKTTKKSIVYSRWLQEIEKYHTNDKESEQVLRWARITEFYQRIIECIPDKENTDNEVEMVLANLDLLLNDVKQYHMFDLREISYVRQLVKKFGIIFDYLLENAIEQVKNYLEKIDEVNVNSFSWNQCPENWYEDGVVTEMDYDKVIDNLLNCKKYELQDVVWIYFNSHLKYNVSINTFVGKCSDKVEIGNKRKGRGVSSAIEALFGDYRLRGTVISGPYYAGARDKLFVVPSNILSDSKYTDDVKAIKNCSSTVSPEYKKIKAKQISCSEKWYTDNKVYAELMRTGDDVYFKICGCVGGKALANCFEFVDELVKCTREDERKTVYPEQLCCWLDYLSEMKSYVSPWEYFAGESAQNFYVYNVMNIGRWSKGYDVKSKKYLSEGKSELGALENRARIALKILDVIESMSESEEKLRVFVDAISYPPLEEINDFRYIVKQGVSETAYIIKYRNKIVPLFFRILKNRNLSSATKRDIFQNTCVRKVFDLEKLYHMIGAVAFTDIGEEKLVIGLHYDSEESNDKKHVFSTKIKSGNSAFFSYRKFIYQGDKNWIKLNDDGSQNSEWIYYCLIEGYDEHKQQFVISKVSADKKLVDEWRKFQKVLRTIREDAVIGTFAEIAAEDFDAIREEKENSAKEKREGVKYKLKSYDEVIDSDRKIKKYIVALNTAMNRRKYDIDETIIILDMIKSVNPFENQVHLSEDMKKHIKSEYSKIFEIYKDKYRSNTSKWSICGVYSRTYFKEIEGVDEFLDSIETDESKKTILRMLCQNS